MRKRREDGVIHPFRSLYLCALRFASRRGHWTPLTHTVPSCPPSSPDVDVGTRASSSFASSRRIPRPNSCRCGRQLFRDSAGVWRLRRLWSMRDGDIHVRCQLHAPQAAHFLRRQLSLTRSSLLPTWSSATIRSEGGGGCSASLPPRSGHGAFLGRRRTSTVRRESAWARPF